MTNGTSKGRRAGSRRLVRESSAQHKADEADQHDNANQHHQDKTTVSCLGFGRRLGDAEGVYEDAYERVERVHGYLDSARSSMDAAVCIRRVARVIQQEPASLPCRRPIWSHILK